MGTRTSKPRTNPAVALALAAATVVALAACGSSSRGAGQGGVSRGGSFSWLRPQRPPGDWKLVRIRNGAELAYPPTWRPQHGDPGTATAVLLRPDGAYLGYLNLTPQQGDETLADWSSFRPDHNRNEGDRAVTRLAAATGLRFPTGTGSCVKDAYTTDIGARFIEIACLVAGARADSVIVGAAPPDAWRRTSATLERAIASVQT